MEVGIIDSSEDCALSLGAYCRGAVIARDAARSKIFKRVYQIGPNAGAKLHGIEEVQGLNVNDFGAVADFCEDNDIIIVLPDSEDQLAKRMRESLEKRGLYCAGVSGDVAWLESRKDLARLAQKDAGLSEYVPELLITNSREEFIEKAPSFIKGQNGLVAAKWVHLCGGKAFNKLTKDPNTLAAALKKYDGFHKKAPYLNYTVVLEEFIGKGKMMELSVFYFVGRDKNGLPVITRYGTAEDNKFLGIKNPGATYFTGQDVTTPVTGGAGSVTPGAIAHAPGVINVSDHIAKTLVDYLDDVKRTPFDGTLYLALGVVYNEKTKNYDVKIVEFNVRGGDPEEPAIRSLLETNITIHMIATSGMDGVHLNKLPPIVNRPGVIANYALMTRGYPETHGDNYGSKFRIPKAIISRPDVDLHIGPTERLDDTILNAGSRFAEVCIHADTFKEAGSKMRQIINPENGLWCGDTEDTQVNESVTDRSTSVMDILQSRGHVSKIAANMR